MIGWELRDFAKSYKTRDITPELPQNAKVLSQQYTENDRLLVRFVGKDQKQKLAVFRLEDGGKPFAIIDDPNPPEKNNDVQVP